MIPFTNIPLVSACFLVIVGILIGNLIWYRYRDKQERLVADLRRQISELGSSLKLQTNEFADAHGKLTAASDQLDHERETVGGLKSQLIQQAKLYETATEDLGTVAQEKQKLEEKLDQLRREHNELREQAVLARENTEAARAEVVQLTGCIETQRSTIDQLTEERKALEQLRVERDQLVTSCREAEERTEYVRSDADQSISSLERQLTVQLREIDELRTDNAEYRQQLELQGQLNSDLSQRIEVVVADVERFERQSAELQSVTTDRNRLIDELDARQQEVKKLTTNLHDACSADAKNREELRNLREQHARLEDQLQELTEQCDSSATQLAEAEKRCSSLERSLASASEDSARLQLERERLEGVEDEVVALDAQLRRLSSDLKQAQKERDEALTTETSTREIAVELRGELNDRLESIEAMETERDAALTQLRELRTRDEQTTQELKTSHDQLVRLNNELATLKRDHETQASQIQLLQDEESSARAKLNELQVREERTAQERTAAIDELRTLKHEHGTLKQDHEVQVDQVQLLQDERNATLAELQEAQTKSERTQRELENQANELRTLKAKHAVLQRDHDARVSQIQHLQQERDATQTLYDQVVEQVRSYREVATADAESATEARSEPANPSSAPVSPGRSYLFRRIQRKQQDLSGEPKPRRSNILGKVFTTAPLHRDDLTQIKGIDALRQEKLNALGIYTYWQIMEWDENVAAEFARRLATDLILKDDWVGQARRLHQGGDRAAA